MKSLQPMLMALILVVLFCIFILLINRRPPHLQPTTSVEKEKIENIKVLESKQVCENSHCINLFIVEYKDVDYMVNDHGGVIQIQK